jgi:hypothetical protein
MNDKRVSILSINIQSLPAKYSELKDLIEMFENKNCAPDVILLQEIWQIDNVNNFDLPNYYPLIYKCRTNARGGVVGIYVRVCIYARAISNKKIFIVIFCDLRKAFDTCDINILLKKMSKLGIRGAELRWFQSYLTNRKQFEAIDDAFSDLLSIIIGVPQGSILGPLLFLLYINDLPACSALLSLLFADDTALAAEDDNLENLSRM